MASKHLCNYSYINSACLMLSTIQKEVETFILNLATILHGWVQGPKHIWFIKQQMRLEHWDLSRTEHKNSKIVYWIIFQMRTWGSKQTWEIFVWRLPDDVSLNNSLASYSSRNDLYLDWNKSNCPCTIFFTWEHYINEQLNFCRNKRNVVKQCPLLGHGNAILIYK